MTSLTEVLEQQLAIHNMTLDEWKSLLQRLLDYGVLCRDDSQVEAEYYDQFIRLEPLINDYLSLIGVRFQHDRHFCYVRLIPPGARLAGMDDENDEPYNGGFRQRLSQHEIALILVLRAEYDKALREGSIDEQGCTALSLESVSLSMKNLLKRNLPEQMVERRHLFRKLRQLRLIHYINETDLDQSESWIKIRPLIVNLVSNEWLEAIRKDSSIGGEILSQNLSEDGDTRSATNASPAGRPAASLNEELDSGVEKSVEKMEKPTTSRSVAVDKKIPIKSDNKKTVAVADRKSSARKAPASKNSAAVVKESEKSTISDTDA